MVEAIVGFGAFDMTSFLGASDSGGGPGGGGGGGANIAGGPFNIGFVLTLFSARDAFISRRVTLSFSLFSFGSVYFVSIG